MGRIFDWIHYIYANIGCNHSFHIYRRKCVLK